MGSVLSNSDSDPILWLQNPSLRPEAVGWKAAVLSDFQSTEVAVPPGFILSPRYFQTFLQGVSWPVACPAYPARQLWHIAEGLQQQVDRLAFPPQWERSLREAYEHLRDCFPNTLYILRPSIGLIHTTGLLESVCHSIGTADAGSLWLRFCEDLRSLYRQCFQARSLLYWHYHQQSLAHLPLAVLVQPLLPAVATGTIEISPQEIQVSATWGMGLGLVRGESVPDRYAFRGSEWVTLQLGQNSWVYWHPETPATVNCPVSSVNCSGKVPAAVRSALTLQQVLPEAQYQPVLTSSQLAILREATLALLSLFSDLRSLEWIFSPSRSNPTDFDLVWTQGASAAVVHFATDNPLNTTGNDRLPPLPDKSLNLIQGQGVSKGVQVGRVYGVESLNTAVQKTANREGWNREAWNREIFNSNGSQDHSNDSSPPPMILVAQQLTPEVFPWLTRVQGLVLAEGGMTCHGAILARELEIPAVVGVGLENLHYLLSQSWIQVDGNEGRVEVLATDTAIEFDQASGHISGGGWPAVGAVENGGNLSQAGLSPVVLPHIPTQVRIFATVNQVASLGAVPTYPVEGVGLLRSEWFCLDLWDGHHPHRWIAEGRQAELQQRFYDRLQRCIETIHPRSLFYRSLDCRAAELQSLVGQEVFPWTVGGTFAHCHDPRVLDLEFEVLHRLDRCGSPVHLVLPMVRTVEEFIYCRDRYRQFLEGAPFSAEPLSLWVMVEVPSLLLQLPALAEAGVQGLVIGPGDLARSLLGLDRGRSGDLVFEVYHPIIHQVILNLLQEAKQLQLPTMLCCHTETLPLAYLAAYVQAGLWGITTEVPHLRDWYLQLTTQPV